MSRVRISNYCSYGQHVIHGYFYTINPQGGYGRDEVLCCEECICKSENKDARDRMIEVGAKELMT